MRAADRHCEAGEVRSTGGKGGGGHEQRQRWEGLTAAAGAPLPSLVWVAAAQGGEASAKARVIACRRDALDGKGASASGGQRPPRTAWRRPRLPPLPPHPSPPADRAAFPPPAPLARGEAPHGRHGERGRAAGRLGRGCRGDRHTAAAGRAVRGRERPSPGVSRLRVPRPPRRWCLAQRHGGAGRTLVSRGPRQKGDNALAAGRPPLAGYPRRVSPTGDAHAAPPSRPRRGSWRRHGSTVARPGRGTVARSRRGRAARVCQTGGASAEKTVVLFGFPTLETVRNGMLIGKIQLKAATWFRSIGHTRHYRRWCGESGDLCARLFAGGTPLGRPVCLICTLDAPADARLVSTAPDRRGGCALCSLRGHARALPSRLCFVGRVSALCARSPAARSRPLPPARLRGGSCRGQDGRSGWGDHTRGGCAKKAERVVVCGTRCLGRGSPRARRHASWKGRRDERVRGGAAIVYGRWAGGAAVAGGSPASPG